ncbi:MAG: hypothetical protein ABI239_12460 [Aquihabitans sp.]
MSDDPNRPDPDHELEVDISAFLPEGSRFATDDDPVADEVAVADEVGLGDGWDTGAPAPEIPAWARDDLPPVPAASEADPAPLDGGDGDSAPGTAANDDTDSDSDTEAIGGTDLVAEVDEAAHGDAPEPEAVANVAPAIPAAPAAPEVDTTVLTRIEGELADVDAAIAAIDSGDLARSPLLAELLAADPAVPARNIETTSNSETA